MIFFYKNYPYSPLATLISALANVFGVGLAVGGIAMIASGLKDFGMILGGVVMIALAVFCFVYVGRKLTDKLSQKWSEKNIRTKPRYALQYCRQHPEAYAELAKLNPAFGEKYMMGENGKVVKRS